MPIEKDDLSSEATRELLALHLREMHSNSPPGHAFALDLSGLRAAEVTVWTARIEGFVAGVAALRQLSGAVGEIKSMRTHPNYLRMGVASSLLDHIIVEAKARGMRRLSLETGSGEAFEPALTLYRRRGFANGDAFGDYTPTAFNQFLHLNLS